jgi:hypothetical protein
MNKKNTFLEHFDVKVSAPATSAEIEAVERL